MPASRAKFDQQMRLIARLSEAIDAAHEAVKGVEDGGTCNFDAPAIHVKDNGGRAVVEAAMAATRLPYYHGSGAFRGYVIVDGITRGMGHAQKRTLAAKAFAESLASGGVRATVYYQAD